MKMQGLSLEQAPPYNIILMYHIIGVVYLFLFSVSLFFYSYGIENRFYYEAIGITHILTLGFFTHIMFGSLFQMVPVIIGESYKNVIFRAKLILISLNFGIFNFILFFMFHIETSLYFAVFFLGTSILYFCIYSFVTIIKTVDKNPTIKTFLTAIIFLAFGTVFGLFALFSYNGYEQNIEVGNIHFTIMIFGWIFLLFSGVVYKVIPMFYVAKEYPKYIKQYLYIFMAIILMLISFFTLFHHTFAVKILHIILALSIAIFTLTTLDILYKRKRKRKDITINFWYFSMFNLALASLIWICSILFKLDIGFTLAIVFGLGFITSLINGMLYKIVPFLTWFHLSSRFIFDAEMSQVIKAKLMKLQFYIFLGSYAVFIIALFYKPAIFVATFLLSVSSLLFLYNIWNGFLYYNKMEEKV